MKLAGSESLNMKDDSGDRVTELLHAMKSLSAYVLLDRIFSTVSLEMCTDLVQHEMLGALFLGYSLYSFLHNFQLVIVLNVDISTKQGPFEGSCCRFCFVNRLLLHVLKLGYAIFSDFVILLV